MIKLISPLQSLSDDSGMQTIIKCSMDSMDKCVGMYVSS